MWLFTVKRILKLSTVMETIQAICSQVITMAEM